MISLIGFRADCGASGDGVGSGVAEVDVPGKAGPLPARLASLAAEG